MKDKKTFGQFLAKRRKEIGLTQEQLGSKLYVGESAVSKWENDKSKPDIVLIKELANIFELSVDELLSASIDYQKRKEKTEAKKYRNIKMTYNLFWFISFGITILTTFIVNLAVNHTLSWFFIVLASLLVAATLLIVPQYIKKNKLRYVPLIFLGSLILLLGVISIYAKGGGWFFVVVFSLFLAYSIVFAPLLIKTEKLPKVIKKNNALFSITANAIILILLLGVINIYTQVVGASKSLWFITIALPITLLCLIPVYGTVFILKAKKMNWQIKTALSIFIWTISVNLINPITTLFGGVSAEGGYFWKINFKMWNTSAASTNNVYGIVTLVAGITALTFLIVGLFNLKKKK
ncbi:MAG: helix-turn-helix domain-containing protein [Erysipelotrichia bacterium]|jgi:transcriptional regulator with XRE-family HTH domain|nr:helix-turn-helix domain-containing protein [Erysipelotrichia bacterium]